MPAFRGANQTMGIFSFLTRQKDTRQEAPEAAAPLDAKLGRTRSRFRDSLLDFLVGKKPIDAELMEELESQLIMADVGVDATTRVMKSLNGRVARSEVGDSDALRGALREELFDLLVPVERPLEIPDADTPFVILVVGVNGAGQDDHDRQARPPAPGRRQERHARRRRHVPGRRRRAAAGLG